MYKYYTLHNIKNIPSKNEGYVYLIEAQGINRYKIGRSVNPIARHSLLKKQSPFPLNIVDCFWTPDCVADEKYLHERMADYRVHGEWFEFDKIFPDKSAINLIRLNQDPFTIKGSSTLDGLARSSTGYIRHISRRYTEQDVYPVVEIINVYNKAKTLTHLHKAHDFLLEYLPRQIHFIWQLKEDCPTYEISYKSYVSGAINAFTFMMLQESQA